MQSVIRNGSQKKVPFKTKAGKYTQNFNRSKFTGRYLSREIPIEGLINLELNQGPGEFVSGPESDSLTVAIKRQPGELFSTTDIVFLPALSVKNALPCDMMIKRRKRMTNED